MAFDWRDFLVFAHELRNEGFESKRRTSIGRAYYYIYNVALIEAKKLGYNPYSNSHLKGGVHKKLWTWCQSHTDADVVALGVSGSTLHARRISVDYNQPSPASVQQDVQKQLRDARDFEILPAQIVKRPPPPPLP
jgi:hypothetical protein